MQGLWTAEESEQGLVKTADRSPFQMLVVSGESDSTVRLMHYPALSRANGSLTGMGHAGGVSCTRFTQDEKLVISLGRKDRGLFQWRLELLDDDEDEEEDE